MIKVKICGLSRQEDIDAVNRALPDYVGFVFAKSKRQVTDETARRLSFGLDPRILAVGVFVNEPIEHVLTLCREGVIQGVQLHGDEDDEYVRQLKGWAGMIIRAQQPAKTPTGEGFPLFDAQRAGGGQCFDWSLLDNYNGPPYFLAGGLSPDNVMSALLRLSPAGVDVSSGVETDGQKDEAKITKFVEIVRGMG